MCSTITSAFSSPVVYQDFSIDMPVPSEEAKIEEMNAPPFTASGVGAAVIVRDDPSGSPEGAAI